MSNNLFLMLELQRNQQELANLYQFLYRMILIVVFQVKCVPDSIFC